MNRLYRRCLYRAVLLSFTVFFIHFGSRAQQYDFAPSPSTFTSIAATGTVVPGLAADEALSDAIPIGFTFSYFGNGYTELLASSNGFLAFDITASDPEYENDIGSTYSDNLNLIAPLWDDLSGTGGTASYATTGSPGDRLFTFEWSQWRWNNQAPNAVISFQVKLYEASGKIEFIYQQENAFALTFPGASIGITGNHPRDFYSLSNASFAPMLDSYGYDYITEMPASGQTYAFTPAGGAITAPTVQASGITVSATYNTMDLAWTNGNSAYRAVFIKETSSTTETAPVVNGVYYPSSSAFGDAPELGSGWYCVHNGLQNNVTVTGLTPEKAYRVQVVEYNGFSAQRYLTTGAADNPRNAATTAVTKPTTPVSIFRLKRVSATQVTLDLIEGDGDGRVIFIKQGNSGTAPVIDNTTYTSNTTFGAGTQAGTSGWYCVYNTEWHEDITITGLTGNTQYILHVVDYNGPVGLEKYNPATAPYNPVTFTTYPAAPLPGYTFTASSGTFTPLDNAVATQANSVEMDDAFSNPIPLGFTFYFGGVPFTGLRASSNGFLTFNAYAGVGNFYVSNNSLESHWVRSVIAPLWDDLEGTHYQDPPASEASYSTTGVAPNRVFTFEWLNWQWSFNASSPAISFQVKLYEANNSIEFIYRTEAGDLVAPGASIGLAFADTGKGQFLSLNNAGTNPTVSSTTENRNIATKPASGQVYRFTPVKLNQAITFNALADKPYSDLNTYKLPATASSGLPVVYTSSNEAVATVSGDTVTITGVGETVITATQSGNGNYNAAAPVQQNLRVIKGTQTVSFDALPSKTLGDAPFTLQATASSGLAISYTSDSDKITIVGNTVTMNKAGSVTITASQPGNQNYNAAATVEHTFCINPPKPDIIVTGMIGDTGLTSSSPDGNQWYQNGSPIANASGTSYVVQQSGTYTVVVTVDQCSSAPSEGMVMTVTGTEPPLAAAIQLYPNPSDHELFVDLSAVTSRTPAVITIHGASGKVVDRLSGTGEIRLPIASWKAGSYILQIAGEDWVITRKVIKK